MPLFSKPVAFAEALKSSKLKKLLPTAASSAELSKLDPQIRERARFMARVNHAGTLARLDAGITSLLDPSDQSGPSDASELRVQMKQHLKSLGYDPENPPKGFEPAKPGSLRDIASDARLNLTIDTNIRMAHGYGRFVKANDADILDDWPCWEFVRDQQRKEPRGRDTWMSRWVRSGGQLYGPSRNRMIARKDDPVWSTPPFSFFGNPYPPFDFNSGMGVEEVDRDEAESLGVIKPSTVVQPQDRGFNTEVSGALSTDTPVHLQKAVRKVFADDASGTVRDGRIVIEARAKDAVEAIDEVYDVAAGGTGKLVKDYAMVTPAEAEKIKETIGVDVSGYRHAVSADDMRHMIKQHGSESTELPRGQLPIGRSDMERIPEIVARGTVREGDTNKIVVYEATIGDSYYYVEEVFKGAKQMMSKSMWKKSAPVPRATQ